MFAAQPSAHRYLITSTGAGCGMAGFYLRDTRSNVGSTYRGMQQDRQALLKLKLRQRRRDEIERRVLAKQLGIDQKDVR